MSVLYIHTSLFANVYCKYVCTCMYSIVNGICVVSSVVCILVHNLYVNPCVPYICNIIGGSAVHIRGCYHV